MNFDNSIKNSIYRMGIGKNYKISNGDWDKLYKMKGSTGVKKLISCFKIIYYLSLSGAILKRAHNKIQIGSWGELLIKSEKRYLLCSEKCREILCSRFLAADPHNLNLSHNLNL